MRLPPPRRPFAPSPIAGAVGIALALGCAMRADSSWGPLQSPAQLAAMTRTLVPDADQRAELPRFDVRQEVLPSGLRLGVEAGDARGMVAVVTVLGSGSSADPPDHEGLAHLVEHLVYHARGKSDRVASERLLRLGAQYNADTGLDTTRFHEVAPAGALAGLLEVASDRVLRPLAGVDEADFDRERAIVENELNQRNELGVYGRVMAWLQGALFPAGHAYARPIGGSKATLRRLTLADARAFAALHYRPSNATLLVVGETGAAALATVASRLPEAMKTRSALAARPAPRALQEAAATAGATAKSAPAAQKPSPPDTLKAAVAVPEIWIAYDLGAGGSEAAIARILSARAAETAVRARLLPEPEVLGVDFHEIELERRSLLACQIVLAHGKRRAELTEKAQGLIWALWSDSGPPAAINWEGWHEGTVLDLRQAALTDAVLGAEPFVKRALGRASLFQASGAIDTYDRMLTAIASARPGDVSTRAFAVLAPERARTLYLDPLPEAERPPPGLVGVPNSDNLPMDATPFRAADLGAPPRVPPPPGLRDARVMTLLNGLTVVFAPRHQFPSVTALLAFHGGAAALPPGVLELVRIVDPRRPDSRRPGTLEVVKVDGAGFTADLVHTDRRHLSNALFLLADRLKAVAEMDWRVLLKRAQARAAQTTDSVPSTPDDPRTVAAARVEAALYGGHPYARRLRGRDVVELDPTLPAAWLPRLYNPRNAVLIVAGDIDVNVAASLISGWFGDWRAKPEAGRLIAPPVPPPGARPIPETVLITHRPVANQVEVTFACRLPAPTTARERVAQELLAGLLDSHLTTEIREHAGAAYSINSEVNVVPGGGAHLTTSMSVDTRRLRDALRVLRGEVNALAAGKIDKGALSQVRWTLARVAALEHQTGLATAAHLLGAVTLGLPIESLTSDNDELARVGAQDLARMFAPCLSSRVLSLVGDEATIRGAM
jgi:zinc protease